MTRADALVRIMRRGTGSVVTWRRAQMVLLSAQGMDAAAIAKVVFTSEDRVRDVIRASTPMGSARCTRSTAGAIRRSSPCRRAVRSRRSPGSGLLSMTCRSLPGACPGWRTSWWLGGFDDISLRTLLREEGVSFQRVKTWKASKDPDYALKKARVEHLYAVADGEVAPDEDEPRVIFCVDEFGPLNLQPRPGRQWAAVSGERRARPRAAAPDARDLHPY